MAHYINYILYNKFLLYVKQIPAVFCVCGDLDTEMSGLLDSSCIWIMVSLLKNYEINLYLFQTIFSGITKLF